MANRFNVGDIEITVVSDGQISFPASAYFPGTTEYQWKQHERLLDHAGNLNFEFSSFVIRSGGSAETVTVPTEADRSLLTMPSLSRSLRTAVTVAIANGLLTRSPSAGPVLEVLLQRHDPALARASGLSYSSGGPRGAHLDTAARMQDEMAERNAHSRHEATLKSRKRMFVLATVLIVTGSVLQILGALPFSLV